MGEASYQRHWGMPEGRIQSVTDQLEEQNEVKCGDAFLVRIPKIEGRIYTRQEGPHLTYVMYIYDTRWDREKKQTRNRKVIIGQAINVYPGAMIPFDAYYQYFDENTGELLPKKENYSMRVFFDDKKERLEYYFDITKENGMDELSNIPYYDDLYLDVTVRENN